MSCIEGSPHLKPWTIIYGAKSKTLITVSLFLSHTALFCLSLTRFALLLMKTGEHKRLGGTISHYSITTSLLIVKLKCLPYCFLSVTNVIVILSSFQKRISLYLRPWVCLTCLQKLRRDLSLRALEASQRSPHHRAFPDSPCN